MPDGAAVSEREAEVLAALGERLTNAEIALRLHISIRTVETHVSSLLRKLDAADRRALAALAGTGAATAGAGRQAAELRGAPIAITSFVGRVQDRKVILEALRSQRLVTLVGVGGIGKTRLATAASIDALPGFAQAHFVDLVPSTPALVVDTVAGAVGAVEHPGVPLLDVLREHLGLASTLLVLDNCEHVRAEAAGLVDALLATTGATVLATSREPLGIPGERVVTVGPMETMGDDGASGDAVVLFAERARAADPSFAVDSRLADVCARLDGMPLAIELAAARVGSLGIDGVSAGLADRLRFLRGGGQESPRHRSVEAMIDWSYDLLAPDEQALFRRLGVFVAGFDLAGATAVAGTDASVAQVADLVGRLAARSLLSNRPAAGGRRWRLLEAVREYALAKLEEAGEQAGTEALHLKWAVETASALAADLATTMGAHADDAIDDLRTALSRVGSNEGASGVNVLAGALARITYARHAWEEAAGHATTAVARASGPSEAIVAHRLAGDIASARLLGDEAFGHYLAAADLAEAAGDRATAAVLVCEATVLSSRNHGEFASVVPLAERKRLFARATQLAPANDPLVAAHLAATRAWHGYPGEPYDPAVIKEALAANRRAGDPVLLSCVLDAELCLALDERRFSDATRGARERAELLSAMPRHEPVTGGEISDTLHSVLMVAFYAGNAQAGVEAAELLAADPVSRGLTYLAASRFVLPLAMLGDFDGALLHGAEMLAGWNKAGRPASAWMSPAARLVALVYGFRGDDAERERWNDVAGEMRSSLSDADPLEWFVHARVALHRGAPVPPTPDIDSTRLRGYEVALAAEVAAAEGRPEAATLIAAARDEWREQKWARACLQRAEARLTGDRHAMTLAADQFEALGARFEWACTRHLAGDADAGALLRQLGCQPPAV